MKPVDQTIFGNPGGNCMSACVASLLELPIRDVPYFGGEDWPHGFFTWLAARGFGAIFLPFAGYLAGGTEGHATLELVLSRIGFYMLGGQSRRGPHCVVARGLEMVHDPHPERSGLESKEDATILVPFEPHLPLERVASFLDRRAAQYREIGIPEVAGILRSNADLIREGELWDGDTGGIG